MEEKEIIGSSEKYVSKEEIGDVVNSFSKLYGIDLEKEKCDFEIEIVKQEEWNEKLAEKEISSAFGLDEKVPKEVIDSYASKRKAPLGEWISAEGKGYLVENSSEGWSKECRDHMLNHELIHAIASIKGSGFTKKNLMGVLFSEDFVDMKGRRQLNEGATEILAIGLSLGSSNLEDIEKVLQKRLSNVRESKEEKKDIGDMYVYMIETFSLLLLLKETNISPKELAQYYVKGDFDSFANRISNTIKEKYPEESRYEEGKFEKYMLFKDCINRLGMGLVFDGIDKF